MKGIELVKEIVDRYNKGEVESAKKLFFLSQWSLPNETREVLRQKLEFKLKLNDKVDETLKTCCDKIGGEIKRDGIELYKK